MLYSEQVQVVGNARFVETRTSEIATTVRNEEVRYLPQNQRNFLNFAALAPGASVSNNEFRKQVTGGGLDATQINVFIDGVSFKNDVLDGGIVGQDSSRGSPFPQTAVQEFQVLTQNYKAEHEKASSLVITAVTRSGGNRWSGEGFLFYQDKGLVANEYFAEQRGDPKPTYDRFQPGGAIGGPIVRDRLQVFGSYEENRQDRSNRVFLGTTPFPPSLDFLRDYEGTFVSPFRERLFFGKLTGQPRPSQTAELSYSLRNETDIRSFGGQTSVESAENVRNRVDSLLGKWTVANSTSLNEATVTYQRSNWNPEPENISDVGLNYQTVMRIGGRDTTQDFIQTRFSLRDDYTRFVQWNGTHTLKGGVVLSFLRYEVAKFLTGNPVFNFRQDESFAFPFEARYGVGNPDLSTDNRQLGFYLQDDWTIGPRLTLNAGVRWDYESDMLNNDYVTPDEVRVATAPFVDGNRYFTDGDDRPPFYGAWQPRVGLSYALSSSGQSRAVRRLRPLLRSRHLQRRPRRAVPPPVRRPQLPVLARRRAAQRPADHRLGSGVPERRRPRRPDRRRHRAGAGSLPHRQRHQAAGLGPVQRRAAHQHPRHPDERQLRRHPRPQRHDVPLRQPPRRRHLLPDHPRLQQHPRLRRRAEELVRRDVPDRGSAVQRALGLPRQLHARRGRRHRRRSLQPRLPHGRGLSAPPGGHRRAAQADRDRHRRHPRRLHLQHNHDAVVRPRLHDHATTRSAPGFDQRQIYLNAGRPPETFNYKSVDMRIEKIFNFGTNQQASIAFEGFNIFDATNFGCYNGNIPVLPNVNPNFGVPSCTVDNSSRRMQFGVRYSF